MVSNNSAIKNERNRCAEIVRERRYSIERKLIEGHRNFSKEQMNYGRRFLTMLTEIEHMILDLPVSIVIKEQQEYLGDFSTEEMERALAIISDQETNPFD